MRFAALLLASLSLAACSKGDAGTGSSAPSTPVAAKPAPAGQSWADTVTRTAEGYVMGNPDAPIKLAEYGSRLCPTCGALARESYDPLTKKYVATGKVSFEFREFMVHGPADLPPALLGLCVDKAAFFPVLEQMFHDQASFDDGLQKLTPAQQQALQTAKPDQVIAMLAEAEGVIPYMKQRGLPEAKIQACLADRATTDKLTKTTQDKTADGTVSGTPTLLINGKVVQGAITWPQLETALKAAGA
ncbi:DsbA family protein [Sphingomonas bacterium]|uniref:DsbA family protein n=1 Tax=Sphingomonas bacterium TaxID=1895847 RepID=UPI00157610DD|nr:thioredoxin domain-containing protein [Sphingomonas bacterium]